MVDPQAVDLLLAHELEHEPVRRLEHPCVLHPDRGEPVDVEEPPVVDLLAGDAPVREAVGLRVEEPVEEVEAARLACAAVEDRDVSVDVRADRGARLHERAEAPLRHLLLPRALGHLRRVGLVAGGELLEARADALELPDVGLLRSEALAELLEPEAEHLRHRAGRDGEEVIPVDEEEGAVLPHEPELPLLKHLAVLRAEHRHEHLVRELGLQRAPVHVEERRVT